MFASAVLLTRNANHKSPPMLGPLNQWISVLSH
jgi:hypothetical protein